MNEETKGYVYLFTYVCLVPRYGINLRDGGGPSLTQEPLFRGGPT